MRHLAIECSGFGGSVSIFEDDLEIARQALPSNIGSVRTLAPSIKSILAQETAKPATPVFISVTAGPGSFTGLRVGITTAKMLGLAWQIPLVAVDTLECIAQRAATACPLELGTLIVPVLNAFRKQVFAGAWAVQNGSLLTVKPTQVVNAQHWQESALYSLVDCSSDKSTLRLGQILVTGPGLREYPLIVPSAGVRCRTLPESIWDPSSTEVGYLGLAKYLQGETSTAESLCANYVRASAAEEIRKGG